MAIESITIEPALGQWLQRAQPDGEALGRSLREWREITRRELGLPTDRTIIATGHQPTLWHPGILAKYIAVDAAVRAAGDAATSLNVIVDQDVVDPAAIEVPFRRSDGALAARRVAFADAGANDVPVGWMKAIHPRSTTIEPLAELPELLRSVEAMRAALAAHADAPNAAMQVGAALGELMADRADVAPMSMLPASRLMATTLARELLTAMARDPRGCAEAYNAAAMAVPEARLTPLAIRDDYVELPLWRLRDATLERLRAYDSDVEAWLEQTRNDRATTLLPRALLMTAMIRLAAADAFVHGRGGAVYDRAMEQWIAAWLKTAVSPMAIVSATLRLPLVRDEDVALLGGGALTRARNRKRGLRHDPETVEIGGARPGPAKRSMLRDIDALPRRSIERRQAFFAMHERLAAMRADQVAAIAENDAQVQRLSRLERDMATALRRDWAFALYPQALLDELVSRIRREAQ